jgi:hypothetical protein
MRPAGYRVAMAVVACQIKFLRHAWPPPAPSIDAVFHVGGGAAADLLRPAIAAA